VEAFARPATIMRKLARCDRRCLGQFPCRWVNAVKLINKTAQDLTRNAVAEPRARQNAGLATPD